MGRSGSTQCRAENPPATRNQQPTKLGLPNRPHHWADRPAARPPARPPAGLTMIACRRPLTRSPPLVNHAEPTSALPRNLSEIVPPSCLSAATTDVS